MRPEGRSDCGRGCHPLPDSLPGEVPKYGYYYSTWLLHLSLDSSPFTSDFKKVRPSDFIMKKSGSIRKDYKISRTPLGKGCS